MAPERYGSSQPPIRLASFDVFDTVLTRALGSPESVFLALGRWLRRNSAITCSPETFAHARVEAEERAYRNAGGECDLEAIHAELRASLGLSESEAEYALRAERAIEQELIRVVPGAVERVAQARNAGQRVAFLSDMYLPAEFIRQQLERHGLWREGDRCLVSCELGQTKSSGAPFRELLAREQVPAHLAMHEGNSREHDLLPALRHGFRVRPRLDANPNIFEHLLERHARQTEGLASAMAGASRLARLNVAAEDEYQAALRDVAAGVAAPTLVGYTLWVLRRAQELGLKRLYFLSRDGQVLLEIARRLVRSLGLNLELRYLYASRQSWNLAGITTDLEKQLAWIWDSTDFLSVESLLARITLEPQDLDQCLAAAGLSAENWTRPLSANERGLLRGILASPPAQKLILERATARRRMLLQYLEQENVLAQAPWGVVDLGWYGSLQNTLSTLVSESGAIQPVGFYFALFDGSVPDECASRREAYYFDQRTQTGFLNAVPDIIVPMEMFCAGDQGTVVDFVQRCGAVEPVLKEATNQPVIVWGLPLVRRTILEFVENLVLDPDLVNPCADVRRATTDVLRAFWVRPTKALARAWAEFPWEDGLGVQTYRNKLAWGYGWIDAIRALRRGRVQPHHRAAWLAASIMLSPPGVRFVLANTPRMRRWSGHLRARLQFTRASLLTQSAASTPSDESASPFLN